MSEIENTLANSSFALERPRNNLRRSASDSRNTVTLRNKKTTGNDKSMLLDEYCISLRRGVSESDISVMAKMQNIKDIDVIKKSASHHRSLQGSTQKKETLRGHALEQLYDKFVSSFEDKKLPNGIQGFQLNDIKDIIYVYVSKGMRKLGAKFAKENEYLSSILNVQIVPISNPTDLSCINCTSPHCESLSGNLDIGPKPWIGLGSVILALSKTEWEQVPSKQDTFSNLSSVTEFLKRKEVIFKKWSVGCHMITKSSCNQVAITSYHSLTDFPTTIPLVFLTEVSISQSTQRTQVKVLCDEYIHQDPITLNESKIGQYDPEKGHNILVLKIKDDVIDLLQNKLKECDLSEKGFTLMSTHGGDLDYNSIVGKRGATTGTTYGMLIARKVHLGYHATNSPVLSAFAVGSIPVSPNQSVPFAKPGDSGSLVFQKVASIDNGTDDQINLSADGLVWRNQELKNNRTGQMDNNATACSKLDVNLQTLAGGPYDDIQVPPTEPSVTFYSRGNAESASNSSK